MCDASYCVGLTGPGVLCVVCLRRGPLSSLELETSVGRTLSWSLWQWRWRFAIRKRVDGCPEGWKSWNECV